MSDLYWLTDEQMPWLKLYFPKSHGKPRVDDRRVLSGIIFVNRNGLRWRDAPTAYGPHKTLYNRWKRWSAAGVFIRTMEGLSGTQAERRTVMFEATYLKANRTVSSLRVKKGLGRLIGRTKGGMNTKFHAVTDASGRPNAQQRRNHDLWLRSGIAAEHSDARCGGDGPRAAARPKRLGQGTKRGKKPVSQKSGFGFELNIWWFLSRQDRHPVRHPAPISPPPPHCRPSCGRSICYRDRRPRRPAWRLSRTGRSGCPTAAADAGTSTRPPGRRPRRPAVR